MQENQVRVTLEGGIIDGTIFITDSNGDPVDYEIGSEIASYYIEWPDRLTFLMMQGEEGHIWTLND